MKLRATVIGCFRALARHAIRHPTLVLGLALLVTLAAVPTVVASASTEIAWVPIIGLGLAAFLATVLCVIPAARGASKVAPAEVLRFE